MSSINQQNPPLTGGTINPPGQSAGTTPPPAWVMKPENQGEASEKNIKISEPIFKKLIPLLGFLLILGIFFLIFTKIVLPIINKNKGGNLNTNGKQIVLTYWGLWEPESVMGPIITEYKTTHPNITINYVLQSYKDYRERLQSALARNEGPDIFRFHNTWLPMLKKDLGPVPSNIAQNFNNSNYYPVEIDNLKSGTQVYGVPLYFDSLGLYYNAKIFSTAGVQPPTTWDDLRKTAIKLTVKDKDDNIQVAGVALGTTNNVDSFSDILGLMMLQNGVDLSSPTGTLAEDALKFYTLFATTDKVWDSTLPSSTYAFATEKVAMMFGPSWRALDIYQINPNLDFKVVPVPQLPDTKIAWASYWVEGVAANSKNSQAAWDFLNYLSSKEVLVKLYSEESKVRKFGEPYPRIDLASQLENDNIIGAFVKQGPYAKTWYLCSNTHDNGINDKIITYFIDAVNSVVQGHSVTEALATASQGVTQVLGQYNIK